MFLFTLGWVETLKVNEHQLNGTALLCDIVFDGNECTLECEHSISNAQHMCSTNCLLAIYSQHSFPA